MIQLILIILPTAYVSKPRPSLDLVITFEPLDRFFSFKKASGSIFKFSNQLTILNAIFVAKPSPS